MNKLLILILAFFSAFLPAHSQSIKIGLLDKINPESVVITISNGSYKFSADGKFFSVYKKNSILFIEQENDKVAVRDKRKLIGKFHYLNFEAIGTECTFLIRSIQPSSAGFKEFDDNLQIRVYENRLQLINKVDLEKYIASVIESEGGSEAPFEYYKAQAILIRTFAIKNMFKHAGDGINMCDDVHCQAYKNKSRMNPEIYSATLETAGMVLVDLDTNLILAPFHSNCGGQTVGSEMYWQKRLPYLNSVEDPFCASGPNAKWQSEIILQEWERFLAGKGVDVNLYSKKYRFEQKKRAQYFTLGPHEISLRDIRENWNLKSTFFSITTKGDHLVLDGKGYGHGVGLCQEGAMEMARVGYQYLDIIYFYFSKIFLVDYRDLELRNY